jgi:hypothetical protein
MPMVNSEEARRLFSVWLANTSAKINVALELVEEKTIETEFGWVYFYTSKEFKENGDITHALAGNAPVIVDRATGSLHVTGTARPTAEYIEEFRQRRAMVGLPTASFVGDPPDDNAILAKLPRDYTDFLQSINGCVVFGGGLHIRGASAKPDWHSLRQAWIGDDRLSQMYPGVSADDIPFAQDCLGDQFLLRSESVLRLYGETGEVESLAIGWREFFRTVAANPNEYLSLQLLEQFRIQGGCLEPGQLLSVYPPLCTTEAANGVSLKPIPAVERIRYLADFAAQISSVSNGSKIQMIVK